MELNNKIWPSVCLCMSGSWTGSASGETGGGFSRSPMALVSGHLSDNVYSGLGKAF